MLFSLLSLSHATTHLEDDDERKNEREPRGSKRIAINKDTDREDTAKVEERWLKKASEKGGGRAAKHRKTW